MQLDGLGIIVTGAANGIGAATLATYVREGARVAALDVEDERGRERTAPLGERARYFHCDVSRKQEVDAAFADAVGWLGRLDVLAHVAAIERGGPAESISQEDWAAVLGVNLMGTVLTNQAAFRHMKEHGGRIINFGSGGAVRGQVGSSHYAASKGGVQAFTRTVAAEWGGYGITVNAVAPGAWTRMYDTYLDRLGEVGRQMAVEAMKRMIPIGGKLGDPERDIAPVMVFLASSAAHFITGQLIAVDGGMVMLGA
ncbi:MAG: SDR family NAD(P)-dependent oxidoreductase [Thermodesulfobacteriota bacterium]